MSNPTRTRFTLRDLPLPAKLVVSAFLMAVGLGYFSALVQLHMKHSSMEGSPLPTPNDVVERFSHFREFDGNFPQSKLEEIISGDPDGSFSKTNMTPAFFGESDGYKKTGKLPKDDPKRKAVDEARDGERHALIEFINSPAEQRKAAYDADAFDLPAKLIGKPITEGYSDGGKLKVKTLVEDRCVKCHKEGEQSPNLSDWKELEPLITAPPMVTIESGGKMWVSSPKTISLDGLTQSTHAHLLSFAILFALTGFVYAFSSHPGFVRGVLAPVVLVAQVADVSCWWLARLDLPYGPMFALAVMGTGAVVGLGLSLQIVLSLFDMYGVKGKLVLLLLFLVAGGGFYALYTNAIKPGLDAEKERATLNLKGQQQPADKDKPQPPEQKPGDGKDPGGKRGGNL
jgi:hypothetical protein